MAQNENQQNRYRVPENVWNNLDLGERNSFERAFERTEKRRNEIIQNLGEDCRPEMQAHFAEISANVCAVFLAELHNTA